MTSIFRIFRRLYCIQCESDVRYWHRKQGHILKTQEQMKNLELQLQETMEYAKRMSDIDIDFTDPKFLREVINTQNEIKEEYNDKRHLDFRFKKVEKKGFRDNVIFLIVGTFIGLILPLLLGLI